jgi:hypothetical protein
MPTLVLDRIATHILWERLWFEGSYRDDAEEFKERKVADADCLDRVQEIGEGLDEEGWSQNRLRRGYFCEVNLTVSAASPHLYVQLPGRWISSEDFEEFTGRHDLFAEIEDDRTIIFACVESTNLLLRAGVCLLSLVNQLAAHAKTSGSGGVRLEFPSQNGLFSFLDRNGFLQLLAPDVVTVPDRPITSSADLYRGHAGSMVEIAEIHPNVTGEDRLNIVRRLVDTLGDQYDSDLRLRLKNAVYSVLSELVNNVYDHSSSAIPGYAALQVYRRTGKVQVVVSDSGIGIPESLRSARGLVVDDRSDDQLILGALSGRLSRYGQHSGHGCGLQRCADLVKQFGRELYVRTPKGQVTLEVVAGQRNALRTVVTPPHARFSGSHVCIEFNLDPASWAKLSPISTN